MKIASAKATKKRQPARGLALDPRSPDFAMNFARAAKAFTRKATRTAKTARAVLVAEGIVTPSGKLTKNYR
jgi:hypothetical protein